MTQNERLLMPRIYIASKTKHFKKWQSLREDGFNIVSTWIDEAEKGDTIDFEDLCNRCIEESFTCDAMIVYYEEGEYLKGAFIEMGVALATRKTPIYLVGDPLLSGSVFTHDLNVWKANSVSHAIQIIYQSKTKIK